MNGEFERFSRRLDDEWRRRRLGALAPKPVTPSERAALLEALDRADPLGSSWLGAWLAELRGALQPWPARMAFATAACAILVIGIVVGRTTTGRPGQVASARLEKPDYRPEPAGTALGIGAPVRPESDAKFREAMAFYDTPEFARTALPLLRDAVALDARNDRAQFWLGAVLLLNDKTAEAIPSLEAATRLAPANKTYQQYLLSAYLLAGDVANALRIHTQLMKQR